MEILRRFMEDSASEKSLAPKSVTNEIETKVLVEQIVKAIVDNPDAVAVNDIEGANSTILEIRVAKEEVGKVIGKSGRTITALRTILGATRAQKSRRYILEILG